MANIYLFLRVLFLLHFFAPRGLYSNSWKYHDNVTLYKCTKHINWVQDYRFLPITTSQINESATWTGRCCFPPRTIMSVYCAGSHLLRWWWNSKVLVPTFYDHEMVWCQIGGQWYGTHEHTKMTARIWDFIDYWSTIILILHAKWIQRGRRLKKLWMNDWPILITRPSYSLGEPITLN